MPVLTPFTRAWGYKHAQLASASQRVLRRCFIRAIAINGRFLSQRITGVQRYATELLRALDEMLAEGELERPATPVEILTPPDTVATQRFKYLSLRPSGWGRGHLWEQLSLPALCRDKLLFTPCGGAPLLHQSHVFTIPDAGVFATPEAYSPRYGKWYRWHHRRALRRVGLQLITVSNFSKGELVRWTGIDPARVLVTLEGHEHALYVPADPTVLDRLNLAAHSYVLAVGSANPNKNLVTLLTAFDRLQNILPEEYRPNCRLVLVSGANPRVFGGHDLMQERVTLTGYLNDGELRALYENAGCFVLPSFYEGFGLPPLEAMALGCPVVCSNAASLPEVCGEAALMVNPHEPQAIAEAIASLLIDPSLRQQMVDRGQQRSKLFRWRDTARLTWSLLLDQARR